MSPFKVLSHAAFLAGLLTVICIICSAQTPIFKPAVLYDSGGYDSVAMVVADVNADGKLDLLVANMCTNTSNCTSGAVGVLLGNGDGTLQPAVAYGSGGSEAIAVAVGDVNGDNKPDLLVANQCGTGNGCNSGSVGVLLGNGDGTFRAAITYDSGGGRAWAVSASDVNGDGKLDLLVSNDGGIAVLLGNGDGTFRPATVWDSGGYIAVSVTATDVNGDSKPDLVAANTYPGIGNYSRGTVGVTLGNGDGTFHNAVTYDPGSSFPRSVAAADVNADGKVDLIVANNSDGSTNGVVGVLLGNGDGTFRPVVTYDAGGAYTMSVAVKDVNGDGKPDIVTGNYCASTASCSSGTVMGSVSILLGNGDGTFQAPISSSSGATFVYSAVAADVDGDGEPDFLVSNACATASCDHGAVGVLLNSTSGSSLKPTATTLASSPNPSGFNQIVTFTAKVTSGATGTVTFRDGAALLGTAVLTGDTATFATIALTAGAHSITAAYSGDSNFGASTSSALVQAVNAAGTATTLVSSPNPSLVNQNVIFTATVTSQFGGTPTGTVSFNQGTSTLGTVPLLNGQASPYQVFTTAGSYPITASYSGDGNNSASVSGVLNQQVSAPAATTTSLVTSGSPSFINQLVVFTATTATPQGSIPDGGIVTFSDGSTAMGTASTRNGVATFSTSSLTPGTHTITAAYAGTGAFKASSGTVQQIVTLYASATTLTSTPNSSVYGQMVTFTATVSSSAPGGPTGTVTFKNGFTSLGTATLTGGVALLSTAKLPAGTFTITATYSGDPRSLTSSGTVSQKINTATTTTSVQSSVNPSTAGQYVRFTATVTSPTTTATGSVLWMDGSSVLAYTSLFSGKATYSTSGLSRGSHSITAVYRGTSNISGSTSPVFPQTVK